MQDPSGDHRDPLPHRGDGHNWSLNSGNVVRILPRSVHAKTRTRTQPQHREGVAGQERLPKVNKPGRQAYAVSARYGSSIRSPLIATAGVGFLRFVTLGAIQDTRNRWVLPYAALPPSDRPTGRQRPGTCPLWKRRQRIEAVGLHSTSPRVRTDETTNARSRSDTTGAVAGEHVLVVDLVR